MIVHYNVCEHCGKQTQITDNKSDEWNDGFEFCFYTLELTESVKGAKFGPKFASATFCHKDCLIEFLKENFELNRDKKNETKRG